MTTPGPRYLDVRVQAALLVGVYAVGVLSVALRPADNPVAGWWPAAGLAVVLVALSRPGVRTLVALAAAVVAATALANLTGGRDLPISLAFGVCNAAEAVVAGLVLRATPYPGRPRLDSLPDFVRLVAAALLGGAVISLGVLVTVAGFGLDGALESARSVFASHAAATLVIAPVALARAGGTHQGRPSELLAQSALLVLATAVVFSPDQDYSLTFLPPLFLVWAALRFDLRTAAVQLLVFAAGTTYLTSLRWGPFADRDVVTASADAASAALNQGYLVCAVLLSLPMALVLQQRNDLLGRVSAEEELFRGSFNDSLVGQLLLRETEDGLRVVDTNDTAQAVLGRPRDLVLGARLDELLVLDAEARLRVASGQPWRGQVTVAVRDGARVDVALGRIAHLSANEQTWAAQLLDVSAEHETRMRLEAAEKLTSATLDTTAAIIIVTDLDGRVVRVNEATRDIAGYSEDDLLGRTIWETTLAPSDTPDLEALFVWPNRSGAPITREHPATTKDGRRILVMWSNNVVRNEHGLPQYAVLTGIDVTTERASAGLVSHLMQAAISTALVGVGQDGRITVVNSGAERLLGHPTSELLGSRFVSLFDPTQLQERLGTGDPEQAFAQITATPNEGEMAARDWLWVTRTGARRIVSITLSATEASLAGEVGFLCVGRDVTEQRQGQEMLVAALEKERTAVERLRAIDEAKNEFVSTVSHELRTPVTSIVGYTEMLQDGTLVDPHPDQLPLFDTIARNGQRLILLCNDLLLLSGLDSGSISWEAEEVDLGVALKNVEDAARPLLADRDLQVIYEEPTYPAVVLGDGSQLERVMLNLVSNAVKFTEDGGVVRSRLRVEGDEAVFSVTDTGLGIPLEEQANLFQRFFRSSTAQKQAIQGTGLGLSIVASIVEAHGGSIDVRSAHLEGATFTVRLPLRSEPAVAATAELGGDPVEV